MQPSLLQRTPIRTEGVIVPVRKGIQEQGRERGASEAESSVRGELWDGALQGDLIDNPTIWNVVGQVVVGFIPIAGQIADIRDTVVSLKRIIFDGGWKSGWEWANLILTLIAWVPGLGDAIKAGGKSFIVFLKKFFKDLGEIGPLLSKNMDRVKKLGHELLTGVNRNFIEPAARYIVKLTDSIKKKANELAEKAGEFYRKSMSVISEKTSPVRKIWGDVFESVTQKIKNKIGKGGRFVDNLMANPKLIWGKSVADVKKAFEEAGYVVKIEPSTKGSKLSTQIRIKGHTEIMNIQIHPGGGRHVTKYYKISTNKGKVWVVPKEFKADPGMKGSIVYID